MSRIEKVKQREKERKRNITIAAVIAVLLVSGGVSWVEKNNSKAIAGNNGKNSAKVDDEEGNLKKNDSNNGGENTADNSSELSERNDNEFKTSQVNDSLQIELPTEENLQVDKIPGYSNIITASKGSEGAVVETVNVGGISLPYNIPNTPLTIESLGQYTGPFVEDGSDTPTANVVALLLKNNSEQMLQYGELQLKVNDETTITFKVSNLPSKTSALVLESTGKVDFNKDNKYEYVDSLSADFVDGASMMADKINVTTEDKKIKIRNISDEDLGTVYVYYKYIQEGGAYLGGITYRSKFENVTADKELEVDAGHFSKDTSVILMIDSIK